MISWLRELLTFNTNPQDYKNLYQDLIALFHFMASEITSDKESAELKDKIKVFFTQEPETRMANIPLFYLTTEQYLVEKDPNKKHTQTSIRKLIKWKFKFIKKIENLYLIFEEEDRQELVLSKLFLLNVLKKSYSILGAIGKNELVELDTWIQSVPDKAYLPVPYKLSKTLPKNNKQWFDLLADISKSTYENIASRFSETMSSSIYKGAYNELAGLYKDLESFIMVINLLPNQLVDEEKINLLSTKQIKTVLFNKMNNLQLINDELGGKNKELKEIQDKLIVTQRRTIMVLDQLKGVMDTVGEGIISIDSKGVIQTVNNEVVKTFGYENQRELEGQNVDIIIPEKYKKRHHEGMAKFNATGMGKIIGKRVRMEGQRKDGDIFPMEMKIQFMSIADESYFTAAIRDITEELRKEMEIRTLARLPGENPEPVIRMSKDGKISYANFASYSILKKWGVQLYGDVPEDWLELIQKTLSDKQNKELELTLEGKVFSVLLVPVVSENYVNFYARDISVLKQAETLVHKQNKEIMDSINYAQRIQTTLLPELESIDDYLDDYFILFKPKNVVSGDFYWTSEKHYQYIFAAIDCVGHGVPGAFMALVANSLMNEVVNINGITEPHLILKELDKLFKALMGKNGSEAFESMDIAICTIDNRKDILAATGKKPTVQFSGAKRPLIYKKGGDTHLLKGDKYQIGGPLYRGEKTFTNHIFEIEEPTSFYVFSDGFPDQFGGENDKKFTVRQLNEIIDDFNDSISMEEQKKVLDTRLTDWQGTRKQMDDILVIGFQV